MLDLSRRPRRNRKSQAMRELIQENTLSVKDLIMPLFVKAEEGKEAISSMPGIFRLGPKELMQEIEQIVKLSIPAVSLFPVLPESSKDPLGKESYNPDHFFQVVIKEIKARYPGLMVMTDVALDPYSSDGHDGIVDPKTGEILNDATLEVLAKMAITQAQSGSDILGPSDMMDGRIGYLRSALDDEGFTTTSIMSYTAKYASSFYGPFRDALESAPKSGDKKSYQMDPSNRREAIIEALLDQDEGADMLMVKPGMPYLDVLRDLRESTHLPLAAYQVSGEYTMLKAASEKGWIDNDKTMLESLLCFKRAGADIVLSYFAKEAATLLN